MKTHRKAYGYVIRHARGMAELLVYTTPLLTLRFPGGTVDENEDPLEGLRRELWEETCISDFNILRALGVHRYYKPDVDKHVERHDYLLQVVNPLPDHFFVEVNSHDKDDGMVFAYHWMSREEIGQLDWEFKEYVAPEYIPEFFHTGEV